MSDANSLVVVTYTPSSQLRAPWKMIRSMWRDLRASRELAWQLFVRDLSAQHRQSLLGIVWAFVPPIVTSIVFIFLQSRSIIQFGKTDIPYAAYVFVGVILWQLFSESVAAPLKSVTLAKPLLVKINFPREALIISALYLVLFNAIIRVVILAVFLLLFRLTPTWGILFAPLAIFMLVLLGMTVGLLLTPFGLLYTDVSNALPLVLQIMFFVTPVVYLLPNSFPFFVISAVNPVSPLLVAARDLITKGVVADVSVLLIVSGLTFFFLFVAWLLYRVALPIAIERLSA